MENELAKLESNIIGYTVRTIVHVCQKRLGNIEISKFISRLVSSMNKHLKPRKPYTNNQITNYLYCRTSWPEMDSNMAVLIVNEALSECYFGPTSVEMLRFLKTADKLILEAYAVKDRTGVMTGTTEQVLADSAQSLFMALDKDTAKALKENLTVCSSLDADDISYMGYVRQWDEDRQTDEIEFCRKHKITLSAGELLDQLKNPGIAQWLKWKGNEFGRNRKREWKNDSTQWNIVWTQLQKVGYSGICSFLTVMSWYVERQITTGPLLSENEITLLLLFKYCLSPKTKTAILTQAKDEAGAFEA